MVEPKYHLITDPVSLIFMLLVLGLLVILPLWIGWKTLNGTYRRWTIMPKIPFQIPNRNTWPFMILCFGLAVAIAFISIPFEIIGWEDGRQFIWDVPFWIPWAGAALAVFYWPLVLTPRWYKRWVSHEDYPNVSPWRPEEVSAVLTLPASKKRDRMVKDMGWCGIDVDAAWAEAGLPGTPPEEWWEKGKRRIEADNAAKGITEDMDIFERATKEHEYREKKKAEKRAAKEARKRSGGA